MKFLHTADWQMGMKALAAGERAAAVRAIRFETAARIAELAKREAVAFVLLAGDLFEDHDVDDAVVRKTVDALEQFAPLPVYVLPGNHDPLVAGGVWDRRSFRRAGEHVRLLTEAAAIEIHDGVVLYPAPLRQKQSALDPTAGIPPRDPGDERIRIGIAHGALDILPEPGNFPISATRAEASGLDYLALGDWHGFRQEGRAVYPGTPEPTSFGEKDPGHVAVVVIEAAGAEPIVTKHTVGRLRWRELRPAIRDATDVQALREEALARGDPGDLVLRVLPQLSAGLPPETLADLKSLREELQGDAFHLDWPEESLDVPPGETVPVPEGLLADVEADLAAILEGRIPEGPARELAGTDPAIVREARTLLLRLAGEALS